jgi:uncharacterized membrane protein YozB (DUF420 family)
MQESNFDEGNSAGVNPLVYWIIWGALLIGSKVAGAFKAVAELLPKEIQAPTHDIKYLPQLNELIPAMITALCCAVISAITYRVIGMIWNKYFPNEK